MRALPKGKREQVQPDNVQQKRSTRQVDDWLTDEGLLLLSIWASDGFSQADIAGMIGVTQKCLCEWKNKYPQIAQALEVHKSVANYRVVKALFKAAIGYKTTETRTITSSAMDGSGNRTVRVEKIEKENGPNVTACLAWLNNKMPNDWKRNRDNEVSVSDGNSSVTINIVKHNDSGTEQTTTRGTPTDDDVQWDDDD